MIERYLAPFIAYQVEVYVTRHKRWVAVPATEERCPFRAKREFEGWILNYPTFALRLVQIPDGRIVGLHDLHQLQELEP